MMAVRHLVLSLMLACLPSAEAAEPDQRWKCENQWIIALDTSPDGKWLAAGSDDGSVTIRTLADEAAPPALVKRFSVPVTALVFLPDGKSVVIGTWDGTLVTCELPGGKVIQKFEEHRETITTLALSPCGKFLASGSADDRLIVWDLADGDDLRTMHQGNEYDVTTLAFSPDGESIATGDGENQLKIWDASTGEAVETLKGHQKPVSAVIYDPGGRLISGSWDRTIRVRGKENTVTLAGHAGEITDLAIDRKGTRLFSGSEDRTVKIWNLKSAKIARTLTGASASIRCLVVTPDGRSVVAGTKGGILRWNLK